MSNIYIQEPPTNGKVLLETTVGDIDIELWSREAPKACRNFVQLCLEGYYDNTIFHRVVKGFIAQGGDPTGTGEGGESIYGKPFKDEFHSRLRFVRRGLVAMANAGKDDNGSQFFFTFAACPELQKKHTIFGKVAGNTIYNMIKLENVLVDGNDRPVYPSKIFRTKVLSNPFPDIIPRVLGKTEETSEKKDEKTSNKKATKDFKLLSFGDEAEEDEEEINEISKEYRGKSKSSHDLIDDPQLSSIPAVGADVDDDDKAESEDEDVKMAKLESVRKKLKLDKPKETKSVESKQTAEDDDIDENHPSKKIKVIKDEYKRLKKEMVAEKLNKNKPIEETVENANDNADDDVPEPVKSYREELEKYDDVRTTKKKKLSDNESKTLAMLEKFQAKLHSTREKLPAEEENEKQEMEEGEDDEDDCNDTKWMAHSLRFESHETKVKDANMKDEDTYEIYDPRNPINQRRREASKQAMRKKTISARR